MELMNSTMIYCKNFVNVIIYPEYNNNKKLKNKKQGLSRVYLIIFMFGKKTFCTSSHSSENKSLNWDCLIWKFSTNYFPTKWHNFLLLSVLYYPNEYHITVLRMFVRKCCILEEEDNLLHILVKYGTK
jgi:hypothetical protein